MIRRVRESLATASGVLLVSLCACGENPTDPATGAIQVSTQTAAATAESSLDTDGYTVVVDSAESLGIESEGTVTFDFVPAGERVVELGGLLDNCTTPTSPDTVTVVAGDTVEVSFAVTCWPPPSGRIVFRRSLYWSDPVYTLEGHIFVMNSDGTGVQRLTQDGFNGGPVWSPDNQRVAFDGAASNMATANWDIYVMNADGTGLIKLTQSASNDASPAWSPDGSQIAFWRDSDEVSGIFVMNADGSDVVQLTDDGDGPAWSPDGSRIAFNCETDVCVMNSDGSGIVNLTNTEQIWDRISAGSWSPDGGKILFNTDRDGSHTNIYVMNADGTDQVQLTFSSFDEAVGSWSPDGTKIAFTSHGGMASRGIIYYMNADGTGRVALTENVEAGVGSDGAPFWSRGS